MRISPDELYPIWHETIQRQSNIRVFHDGRPELRRLQQDLSLYFPHISQHEYARYVANMITPLAEIIASSMHTTSAAAFAQETENSTMRRRDLIFMLNREVCRQLPVRRAAGELDGSVTALRDLGNQQTLIHLHKNGIFAQEVTQRLRAVDTVLARSEASFKQFLGDYRFLTAAKRRVEEQRRAGGGSRTRLSRNYSNHASRNCGPIRWLEKGVTDVIFNPRYYQSSQNSLDGAPVPNQPIMRASVSSYNDPHTRPHVSIEKQQLPFGTTGDLPVATKVMRCDVDFRASTDVPEGTFKRAVSGAIGDRNANGSTERIAAMAREGNLPQELIWQWNAGFRAELAQRLQSMGANGSAVQRTLISKINTNCGWSDPRLKTASRLHRKVAALWLLQDRKERPARQ